MTYHRIWVIVFLSYRFLCTPSLYWGASAGVNLLDNFTLCLVGCFDPTQGVFFCEIHEVVGKDYYLSFKHISIKILNYIGALRRR